MKITISFFIIISLMSSNTLIPSYSEDSIQDFNIGKIEWSEKCHPLVFNIGLLRVTDPDMNLDPNVSDKLEIKVWSNFAENGHLGKVLTLTATETGTSTGIFEAAVFFGECF